MHLPDMTSSQDSCNITQHYQAS